MSAPPLPSANHGTQGVSPRARYRTMPARPRRQPRAAPPSSTAKVWPVIGTGGNGSLIAAWAGGGPAGSGGAGGGRSATRTLAAPFLVGGGAGLSGQLYVAGRPRRAARPSSAKRRSQQALCQWRRWVGSPSGQTTTWRVRGKISWWQPGQRYTLMAREGCPERRGQ